MGGGKCETEKTKGHQPLTHYLVEIICIKQISWLKNMECTLLEQLLNRLAITVHMVQLY
jgi:hypothetical protein